MNTSLTFSQVLQMVWVRASVEALIVFVLSAFLLTKIKRLLLGRFQGFAAKTSQKWDDELLEVLAFPLQVLVIVLALSISVQILPLGSGLQHTMTLFSKGAFVLVVGWILSRGLSIYLRTGALPQSFSPSTRVLISTGLQLTVGTLAILLALDNLGVSITPLLASLGVGSVAVALALQDTLSNFFSGVYLLIDEPLRSGDYVKLDGSIEGIVKKIGWRSTRIQQLGNNTVVIPNSKLSSSTLINYDMPERELAVLVELGVSYDSDLNEVERITIEVAKEVQKRVPGAIAGFEPFIRYHTFADSSINFTVILRANQFVDNFVLKHEFIKALHARYNAEKIEIPFPQRVLHIAPAELNSALQPQTIRVSTAQPVLE